MEYVIADMNCFLPHLLNYILAKMILEVGRLQLQCNRTVLEDWSLFISALGLVGAGYDAALALVDISCRKRAVLTIAEADSLRNHFKAVSMSQ